jgi:hypothetical protein
MRSFGRAVPLFDEAVRFEKRQAAKLVRKRH